ncbi:unnamed protein product [Bursaphelenchus xylophilus]|uniref:(pine wood nematode) hypothetical protein n=1 Tax=Bursaphelenchus xylophilus TaxID=6326 RepID=A0A1I7RMY1_BURXY|nr:unnamed protein product [Bursaphelenchus xylophilus]CAG9125354.1 unnamed protein product [Bursaphelenchus xylophilus]
MYSVILTALTGLASIIISNRGVAKSKYEKLKSRIYEIDTNILRKKIKFIQNYLWPEDSVVRANVSICLILMGFKRIANILIPLCNKWIVDDLTEKKSFCWELIAFAFLLAVLSGGGFSSGVLRSLSNSAWKKVENYNHLHMEVDVYNHVLRLPYNWHVNKKSAELWEIVNRGTSSVEMLIHMIFFSLGPTLFDVFSSLLLFYNVFDGTLTLLVFIIVVIYVITTGVVCKMQDRQQMWKARGEALSLRADALMNYETVKYFCNEPMEADRFKEATIKYQAHDDENKILRRVTDGVENVVTGFVFMLGSLLVAYKISRPGSNMSAGDYILFTTHFTQMISPLSYISYVFDSVWESFCQLGPLIELLEMPTENQKAIGFVDSEIEGSIRVEKVSFAYKEAKVLDNVSFEVPEGKTVALVGPSGSGKSTIVRMLYRLLEPTEGSISLAHNDIRNLDLYKMRSKMATVPQDCVLFDDTIKYNIGYGRSTATDEEIEEAAKNAQLLDLINRSAEKFETKVGERGLKLSGGEKQRVAIARTLLKNPKYLFLDEATSSLDSCTEKQIQSALMNLCENRTCVIVAHRLSTIAHADNIVVLKNGKVVEQGNHNELLAKNGLYSEMWRIQQEGQGAKMTGEN